MSQIEKTTKLEIQFEKRGGLVPVIVQDEKSLQVLMLGYANVEAVDKTIQTGLATFYSTSRDELWTKGLTSGDTMKVKQIRVDCDQDAILYIVEPIGGTCHTKNELNNTRKSCFYRELKIGETELDFLEK